MTEVFLAFLIRLTYFAAQVGIVTAAVVYVVKRFSAGHRETE